MFYDILVFLLIILVITLSSFFASAETALTAVSRARLHQQSKQGNYRAQLIVRLQSRMEQVIGTVLAGNNALNTFATAIAAGLFTSWWGAKGAVISGCVMSFVVILFAEILPKVYAFQYPEKVAFFVAPFLDRMVNIFSPFTRLLNTVARAIFKMVGTKIQTENVEGAEEELRGAIALHVRRGQLARSHVITEEKAMLNGILDLHAITVEEIMVHRKNIVMLPDTATMADIQELARTSPHTRFPVYHEDPENIIGVFNMRDLWGQTPETFTIKEWVRVPWFIPNTRLLSDQLQAFREKKLHMALVVDEYGALEGVVTLLDILEEIVGDIMDEQEEEFVEVTSDINGEVEVAGETTLRDLNRQFGWTLDDEEAATVAGLMLHLGKIPEVDDEYRAQGFLFRVVDTDGPQVTRVRIIPARMDE